MPVSSLFLGPAPLARLAVLSFLSTALAQSSLGPYTYYGCVNEATTERILFDSHTDYPDMTLESCASDCAGYTYFGTEYSTECYCGNDFTESPVTVPDSYCWMTCGGNSDEFCGGPMLLSVYSVPVADTGSVSSSSSSSVAAASSTSISSAAQTSSSSSPSAATSSSSSMAPSSSSAAASTTTSSSAAPSSTCVRLGCFTESGATTPDRTLYDAHYIDYDLMSPEICESQCEGYSYFGVEYGGECYCGEQINPQSYIVDDSQCAMPCGGNPGEFCGSGNRLDVYSCVGPLSSSSSAAASTSSISSSAAASSTAIVASPTSSISSTSSTDSPPFVAAASLPPAETSTSSSSSLSATISSSSTFAATPSSSSSSSVATSSSTSSVDPPSSSSSSSVVASSSTSSVDPPPVPTSSPSSSSSASVSSYGTMTSSMSVSSPCPSSTTAVSSPHTITSTIYSATTYTITSCAATVTDCPARIGKLTTEIVTLYTTYCPEAGKATPTPAPTPSPSPSSTPHYVTSIVYTTTVYTITSCAATVTNCPAKMGQVTTETIALYTTFCPEAGKPSSTPGGIGPPTMIATPLVTPSTMVKMTGSSVTPLSSAKGAAAPIYPASNGTTLGVAASKSTGSGAVPKTTVSVVPVRASGAERLGGSILAGIIAAVGAFVLL